MKMIMKIFHYDGSSKYLWGAVKKCGTAVLCWEIDSDAKCDNNALSNEFCISFSILKALLKS